jgi:hypothetical protein
MKSPSIEMSTSISNSVFVALDPYHLSFVLASDYFDQ